MLKSVLCYVALSGALVLVVLGAWTTYRWNVESDLRQQSARYWSKMGRDLILSGDMEAGYRHVDRLLELAPQSEWRHPVPFDAWGQEHREAYLKDVDVTTERTEGLLITTFHWRASPDDVQAYYVLPVSEEGPPDWYGVMVLTSSYCMYVKRPQDEMDSPKYVRRMRHHWGSDVAPLEIIRDVFLEEPQTAGH